MIENFQQDFEQFQQLFKKLEETNFNSYEDVNSDSYQAYYQAYYKLYSYIGQLREQNKAAFASEINIILKFWASHCGSWMDLDIGNKLLQTLIDEGFLSQPEIEVFNQHICYRQG